MSEPQIKQKDVKQKRVRTEKQKANDILLQERLLAYHNQKKLEKEIKEAHIIKELTEEIKSDEPVEVKLKRGRPKKTEQQIMQDKIAKGYLPPTRLIIDVDEQKNILDRMANGYLPPV